MPYQGEHSCRVNDPDKYDEKRRENDYFEKGIHVIWGYNEGESTEIQAIRFDSDKFTVKQAKDWLKDHDFECIMFEKAIEDTENRFAGLKPKIKYN